MVKKILYCDSNIDGTIGGSYYSLFYLVDGLNKHKFQPLVVFYTDNALIPMYRAAGIETVVFDRPKPFHMPDWILTTIGRIPLLKQAFSASQKLVNFIRFLPMTTLRYALFLRRQKIDLVHLNNSILRSHDWILAAMLTRRKCVVHERGINPRYLRLSHFFAARIAAIICISYAVEKSLLDGGIRSANLVMVYNGVDPERVRVTEPPEVIRARHNIPPDATIVGVVGNIKGWKGQKTLIDAMVAIRAHHPRTICLVIGDTASSDKYYLDELLGAVEKQGLHDAVFFTGFQNNVPDYYNIMDIVIHTSTLPEPFGRVLIEAMALHKPVIASDAGAVPEIVEDGVTGLLYPPGDHQALAECIISLLNNPSGLRKMGVAGYQRLIDNFSIAKYVAGVEKVYEQVLK